MLVVYGKGRSAKELARGLDGFWHSSESNTLRQWRNHGRGRGSWIRPAHRLRESQRVVNYGHIHPHSAERTTLTLNRTIVHNKYNQLVQMQRADGVVVPDHQRARPTVPGWLCRAYQHQRGTDIREGTQEPGRTIQRREPCVCAGCNNRHERILDNYTQGRTTYPNADYYVAYIKKEREFRVHVINGASVRMCEKIPRNRGATVWNSDNSHFSFADITPRETRQAVRQMAKAAVVALGMDFGAVDIMWHRGEAIVLEVNSAPSLTENDSTLERYVEHIRRWEGGDNR